MVLASNDFMMLKTAVSGLTNLFILKSAVLLALTELSV
jgi:hypothetical protein